MRHLNKKKSLGREFGAREALVRGLMRDLILRESIRTTLAKAKFLRPHIERLVTIAKHGELNDRRLLLARLPSDEAVKKLMSEIGPKYRGRAGGYTRITKLAPRVNDAAKMARIEFV